MSSPQYKGVPMIRFRRYRFFIAFALAVSGRGAPVFAQDPAILAAYRRNFQRASLAGKPAVLHDAASDDAAPLFLGGLYEYALDFCTGNADVLRDDPDFVALTVLAAKGAGERGGRSAVPGLWTAFASFRDTVIRVQALESLAVLAPGDRELAEKLEYFLTGQTELYLSGTVVDYITLSACIRALAAIAGSGAIPELYAAAEAGFPAEVSESAELALQSLAGQDEYLDYLKQAVRVRPPAGKLAAFRRGMRNAAFDAARRGDLAETALEAALEGDPGEDAAFAALCREAVPVLGESRQVRAAPLLLRRYSRLYQDWLQDDTLAAELADTARALGRMESAEAAQTLSLHLGQLNSRMEHSGGADETFALSLVEALGELGHRSAFDNLFYVSYLSWSETVQNAAREALNRLRW